MNKITSTQNPIIKEIKSLQKKKYRYENQIFFIEGERFVEDAIKSNVKIKKIIISEFYLNKNESMIKEVNQEKYEVFIVEDKLFNSISDTENPQGILAIIGMESFKFEDIITDNNFLIVLDNIQDPGNMGTIIRTADAAGSNGILLSKGCVDIYNPKVLRATMGSVFHIPIFNCEDLYKSLIDLKAKDIKILTSYLKGSTDYFKIDMKTNIAIIIGNEANGVSEEIVSVADELVKIPMFGQAESLNASVASALLMYEVVRQRMGDRR